MNYADVLTERQKALVEKHGTPDEFAVACYAAVPGWISVDEAEDGIRKYREEFAEAGRV